MPRSSIAVWGAWVVGVVCLTATAAVAQPFELTVKKDRLFGAGEGTLVFTADGVDYLTTDVEDGRQWGYDDLKQILILSSTHVVIATYEDQGWLKLGAAFGQQILDIPEAQAVPVVQPHRVADDVSRKAMPQVAGSTSTHPGIVPRGELT